MADDIPQWARDRADSLIAEYPWSVPWRTSGIDGNRIALAFATYIAAHEEAPPDPIEVEARRILRDAFMEDDGELSEAEADRQVAQSGISLGAVTAALKRGMELAGER